MADAVVGFDRYEHLRFERRRGGVLVITIDRPEVLNAANERLHRELSEVWPAVDADPTVAVSVITGAGRAFSAGGDLAMIERMTLSFEATVEQWRDAGAIVEAMLASTKPIVSAINGVAVGAGLAVALLADVSIVGRVGPPLRRPRTAGRGRRRPRRAVVAPPVRHGQGQVLPVDRRLRRRARGRADRPGDPLRARRPGARRGPGGGRPPGRGERHRRSSGPSGSSTSGSASPPPVFGESLALEMLGFLGPDAKEGLAALQERREPRFPSPELTRGPPGPPPAEPALLDGDQGADRGHRVDDGGVGRRHLDAAVALGEAVAAPHEAVQGVAPLK